MLTAAAAVPLLLVALAGCGYGSKADAGTAAAPSGGSGKKLSTGTVKIGFFANVTHATPLVGLKEGLFQKELGGTKVSQRTFNAGPSEIEALNAGSIDIGWIGPSPAINGYVKSHGRSLRIISGATSGGASLVVDPAKIRGVDDLKGKKIASPQLGNTQDVALLNFLAGKGFHVDATTGRGDVTVERLDNATTPTSYKSGAIDGAWVPEPTASKLVAAGAKTLVDERTLWKGGQFVATNVVVSQSFLKDHPDVVEAVLRASVNTNAWIKANPDRAATDVNAQLGALTGKPLPAAVIASAFKNIQVTDDPLAASLQEEADHAVKAGLLKAPDLKGIYDLAPLNKVLKAAGHPTVSDAGLSAH
nr:aliphatic sulfonate ABC transporter substrate-binding protein [Streptomyces sp. SID5468]